MNHTTQSFSRTARQSGTERAASIERSRRTDTSGVLIVAGVIALTAIALAALAFGGALAANFIANYF